MAQVGNPEGADKPNKKVIFGSTRTNVGLITMPVL